MVESVIKCYALYLFLPCATRPNGSGHPERCGNAACKGQNFHAELCPLSISPEIVGSRLNNGAASVFLGALGERHGGLQHALHCFWRKAPRFVIARRPTWQSRGTCRIIGKPSAKSQLPSRDCTPRALPRASRSGRHGPFGASQWHVRRVQRYTSALLPLNCPPQGGHYPQGARRIRKAVKPPTAAQ